MYEKYDKMYEKQMYENLTLELHRTVLLSYSTVCLFVCVVLSFFSSRMAKTKRIASPLRRQMAALGSLRPSTCLH